ncbi:MAG: hypothetical protein AAGA54_24395 [Myxococcota bacterium]
MTLAFRSGTLLSSLALVGCVSTQVLGDPQATDGGSGGGDSGGGDSGGLGSSDGSSTAAESSTEGGTTTTVSSTDGDSTEGDTDTAGEAQMCSEFTPPPIDCPEVGDGSAQLVDVGGDGTFDTVALEQSQTCVVGDALPGPVAGEVIAIDCGDFTSTFSFASEPDLLSGLEVGESVGYAAVDTEHPNPEPSIAIYDPDGTLRFAFVDERNLDNGIQTSLGNLEVSVLGTGCAGFDAQAVVCGVDGELILGARVSVALTAGDQSLELSEGEQGEIIVGDVTYDVIIDQAERIVCWDESCAGDESGPWDRLRMLIVAR